ARADAERDDRGDPRAGRRRLRAAPVRPDALGPRLRASARPPRRGRRDRGLQPAGGDQRLQRRGGPLRGQVPDHRRRRLGLPRRAGPRLGADQHAGLRGTPRVPAVAARRRHQHAPLLAALRAGAEVPADTGHAPLGPPGEQGPPAEARAGRGEQEIGAARARGRGSGTQLLMHRQGQDEAPSNPSGPMPVTDDEIREKYLERAIRELNSLTRELQSCPHCPRGNLMPVLGSGHPQADVFLLKYAPVPSEIEEGVAFYGRSGSALMKSLKRLGIDPLAVYGTLCVKCPVADPSLADPACLARIVEELAIVAPRIVVVMGDDALDALNDLD